jgi:type I restriction enzyme, S subunit
MSVKPGFKQTDVGVIPEDWHLRPIHAFAEIRGRVGWKGYTRKDLVPYGPYAIGAKHIDSSNRLDLSDPTYLSRSKYLESPEIMVRTGDILIVQRGTIGKLALVDGPIGEATINPSMVIIRTRNVCSGFVTRYLLSHAGLNQILADTSMTGVPMISQKQIGSFLVPLPPTAAEQEAIAEALGDADVLIKSLEQLLAKKRHLKQGAMQELLTGRKRLPGFSDDWEERTLFDLAGRNKDLFDDGDWIESEHITDDKGIRLVQTGNIGVGTFIERDDKKYIFETSFVSLRCKEIKQGDLLICRLAEPAGRACVLPNIGEAKIITSVDVTIFRPPVSVANRVFLANLFSTNQWFRAVSDRSGGTTHKRISRRALGLLRITVPSVEEQTAIAAILSEMDAEIAALEAKLSKARHLKQGMMQQLLTGRIRLV